MRRVLLCSLLVMTASLTFATAAAGPATAAPNGTARLSPLSARLLAAGAAVQAGVEYSCSKNSTSNFLYLRVTERVLGGHVAQGSGSSDALRCDGLKHTIELDVVSENSFAFRKGIALAQGTLTACDAVPACATVAFSETIRTE